MSSAALAASLLSPDEVAEQGLASSLVRCAPGQGSTRRRSCCLRHCWDSLGAPSVSRTRGLLASVPQDAFVLAVQAWVVNEAPATLFLQGAALLARETAAVLCRPPGLAGAPATPGATTATRAEIC